MTRNDIKELLKTSLGEPNASEARLALFSIKIEDAICRIKTEGITLSEPNFTEEDSGLILSYAEFLIRKRATDEGLPRFIRWAMNNRLMSKEDN